MMFEEVAKMVFGPMVGPGVGLKLSNESGKMMSRKDGG
jgi:hypothetical protein